MKLALILSVVAMLGIATTSPYYRRRQPLYIRGASASNRLSLRAIPSSSGRSTTSTGTDSSTDTSSSGLSDDSIYTRNVASFLASIDIKEDHNAKEKQKHRSPHIVGTFLAGEKNPNAMKKRNDPDWPWDRLPHVVGIFPDGKPKCIIYSSTAGPTEGHCPPKLSPQEVHHILRLEYCKNNCCDVNLDPCRASMHTKFEAHGPKGM